MKFITLNRPDIVDTTYGNGERYAGIHKKQEAVTINPDKIISMIEYCDSDGNFDFTCVNMEGSLHYNVLCRVDEIIRLINCDDSEIVQVNIVGTVMTV